MRNGDLDRELTTSGKETSSNAVEDLGHDKNTDVSIGLSERNEKSRAEKDTRDTGVGGPLEITSVADNARGELALAT